MVFGSLELAAQEMEGGMGGSAQSCQHLGIAAEEPAEGFARDRVFAAFSHHPLHCLEASMRERLCRRWGAGLGTPCMPMRSAHTPQILEQAPESRCVCRKWRRAGLEIP